jgi:hypothetical protein
MCGIAGYHWKTGKATFNKRVTEAFVDSLLCGIEHRGIEATGFVAVSNSNKVSLDKKAVKASDFIKSRANLPTNTRTALLHTRLATKGSISVPVNNHPVVYRTCFSIHNGMIYNDDDLFKEYSLDRHGEVDSEIIPALFSHYGLSDYRQPLEKLIGSFAIATINPIDNPGELLLARGSNSPMYIYENDTLVVWASTATAILEASKSALNIELDPKEVKALLPGDLRYYKNDGEAITDTFAPAERPVIRYNIPTYYQSKRSGSTKVWGIQRRDDESKTNLLEKLNISENEMSDFADYALTESEIHRLIIKGIDKETGLDSEVIEFVLFRSPHDMLAQPRYKALFNYLAEMYEKMETSVWDTFGDSFAGTQTWVDIMGDSLMGKQPPKDVRLIDDKKNDWGWCNIHQDYYAPNMSCEFCELEIEDAYANATVERPLPPISSDTIPANTTLVQASETQTATCRNAKCRKKARVWIIGDDHKLGWCESHYAVCVVDKHEKEQAAKNTTVEGVRVCHNHSRGKTHIADSQLIKNGYHMEKVK